ncbi:GNAT family N-acetyltransferase [Nocardia abscessus]|uniref:GNAT family N-acetyltransferase n=1 Tax=Nocardia abscessus TaxID=120957 RepID=UPI003A5CCB2B
MRSALERSSGHAGRAEDDDSELWGTGATPAYYISRLAVARNASSVGRGYHLIDWVADRAAECGRQYVRLATAGNNSALRHYYGCRDHQ